MNIKLNGENKLLNEAASLLSFISGYLNGSEPKGIAIAVNGRVIPKQKWESVSINENDEIEIIQAVQGG